ncbi:MAG: hypothetical protein FJW40_21295 [Acidobacteria bacterium]|nr:hypothetical protein [Acidobacteriota bacterium]
MNTPENPDTGNSTTESGEAPVTGYCRTCGTPLTAATMRAVQGTIYCATHAPAAAEPASPYTAPAPAAAVPASVSPGLAFILGLIPGVGAIYNGQYAKGLIHVMIYGLLISLVNSHATDGLEPVFGLLIMASTFYMAFEAYHTAQRRAQGLPVEEFSSLFPLRSPEAGFPVGPVIMIGLGILFLLNNLDLLRVRQLLRYWPVGLIAMGVYMLYNRIAAQPVRTVNGQEATNE